MLWLTHWRSDWSPRCDEAGPSPRCLKPRSCDAPQLGKASPALAAFKAAFKDAAINRGTVVTLSAAKGGKLTCVVAGKAQKPIASPELCRALFDIYLGKDPVAPAAKAAFGEALAKRIAA